MKLSSTLLLVLGACSSLVVDASSKQDPTAASVVKAKQKFHSYQSDPLNLLRGIQADEYEQIYIQYHHCVWSEFGNNDDNYEETRCSGNGDGEDQPWYMGNTQCYRANVAYSLYGVRVGDEAPENACKKRYYINTFFTNNGMEEFGDLLGLENHEDATSVCTLAENEDEGNKNEEGDDEISFKQNVAMYPGAHSYTTYCYHGKFVTAQFRGAYCTGKSELEMLDKLTDLNNELDQIDCVLAYSAEEEDEGEENGRQLEEGKHEEEEGGVDNEGFWDLLSYSITCNTFEHPKGCPDPFGVKKHFDLNPRTSNILWKRMNWIDRVSVILFVLGGLMFALTFFIKDKETAQKPKRNVFGFRRRGRSRSPSLREPSRRRGRSRSPSKDRVSSGYRSANDDATTVNTSSEPVEKKKKGGLRGMFSRKK